MLFKKFAGIDCFDIEVDADDPERFIEVVAALEPTFGAINLEDIKAPECFEIERRLRDRMKIPVFHDDQHGTAIIVAAAVRNAMQLQGKQLGRRAPGQLRRRGGGAGHGGPAVRHGAAARERDADRHQGRDLRRARAGHAAQHGPLRQPDRRAHAGGRAARRRHLPRPVRPARAEGGVAAAAGGQAADPGAGQPGAGDPAGGGARRPAGRDRRHRAQRLPEPGQQRAVLPVHLPRRAGRGRHQHQRGDEGRLRRGDRRAGAGGGERGGGRGLWRRGPRVRPRLHHPQAVRPAADPADRPRGGAGRDAHRRRHPADRGLRRLPPRAGGVRLPLRPADAPGVRGGAQIPPPHRLCRGRGRAGAARGADHRG